MTDRIMTRHEIEQVYSGDSGVELREIYRVVRRNNIPESATVTIQHVPSKKWGERGIHRMHITWEAPKVETPPECSTCGHEEMKHHPTRTETWCIHGIANVNGEACDCKGYTA